MFSMDRTVVLLKDRFLQKTNISIKEVRVNLKWILEVHHHNSLCYSNFWQTWTVLQKFESKFYPVFTFWVTSTTMIFWY